MFDSQTSNQCSSKELISAGAVIHPFLLLTRTATLPFALFLRLTIVSVHVKIRRQGLQSIILKKIDK